MLTSAQVTTLKNDIAANTATILVAGVATPIKDVAHNPDLAPDVAAWYNGLASPSYWVWRSSVSRADVYNGAPDTGSTWDWTSYKNQSVTEQNAWVQMFMGDVANFAQLNIRVGIGKIFTGSAQANAQRDHCLAVGRRVCSNAEKLFATAVTSPPANTGNDGVAGNRGKTTNPDVMGFEGNLTVTDVIRAWAA